MYLALLVPQLPRLQESRAHYNGLLNLEGRPHVAARALAALRTACARLALS